MAESAISSGTAGSSKDGAENTAAIAAGIALIAIAAASSIVLQVGKNAPQIQTVEYYSGPSLSYYVNKFKPPEITQAPPMVSETEVSSSVEPESSPPPEEVSQVQVESLVQPETSSVNTE